MDSLDFLLIKGLSAGIHTSWIKYVRLLYQGRARVRIFRKGNFIWYTAVLFGAHHQIIRTRKWVYADSYSYISVPPAKLSFRDKTKNFAHVIFGHPLYDLMLGFECILVYSISIAEDAAKFPFNSLEPPHKWPPHQTNPHTSNTYIVILLAR